MGFAEKIAAQRAAQEEAARAATVQTPSVPRTPAAAPAPKAMSFAEKMAARRLEEAVNPEPVEAVIPPAPSLPVPIVQDALKDEGVKVYQPVLGGGDEDFTDPDPRGKAEIENFGAAWKMTELDMQVGRERAQWAAASAEDRKEIEKRISALKSQKQTLKLKADMLGFAGSAAAQLLPFLKESMIKGGKGGMIGAMVGGGSALLAGQAPGLNVLPEEAITVPGMTALGAKIGASFGSMSNIQQLEYGMSLDGLLEKGVKPEIAIPAAQIYSIGSTALEAVNLKLLSKVIPGGGKIFKSKLDDAFKKAVDMLADTPVTKGVATGALATAGEATVETTQQLLENVVGIFSTDLMDHLEGSELSPESKQEYWDAATEGLADTFKTTFVGFGIVAVPGVGIKVINETDAQDLKSQLEGNITPVEEETTTEEKPKKKKEPKPKPEKKEELTKEEKEALAEKRKARREAAQKKVEDLKKEKDNDFTMGETKDEDENLTEEQKKVQKAIKKADKKIAEDKKKFKTPEPVDDGENAGPDGKDTPPPKKQDPLDVSLGGMTDEQKKRMAELEKKAAGGVAPTPKKPDVKLTDKEKLIGKGLKVQPEGTVDGLVHFSDPNSTNENGKPGNFSVPEEDFKKNGIDAVKKARDDMRRINDSSPIQKKAAAKHGLTPLGQDNDGKFIFKDNEGNEIKVNKLAHIPEVLEEQQRQAAEEADVDTLAAMREKYHITDDEGKPKVSFSYNQLTRPAIRLTDGSIYQSKEENPAPSPSDKYGDSESMRKNIADLKARAKEKGLYTGNAKVGFMIDGKFVSSEDIAGASKGEKGSLKKRALSGAERVQAEKEESVVKDEKKSKERIEAQQKRIKKIVKGQTPAAKLAATKMLSNSEYYGIVNAAIKSEKNSDLGKDVDINELRSEAEEALWIFLSKQERRHLSLFARANPKNKKLNRTVAWTEDGKPLTVAQVILGGAKTAVRNALKNRLKTVHGQRAGMTRSQVNDAIKNRTFQSATSYSEGGAVQSDADATARAVGEATANSKVVGTQKPEGPATDTKYREKVDDATRDWLDLKAKVKLTEEEKKNLAKARDDLIKLNAWDKNNYRPVNVGTHAPSVMKRPKLSAADLAAKEEADRKARIERDRKAAANTGRLVDKEDKKIEGAKVKLKKKNKKGETVEYEAPAPVELGTANKVTNELRRRKGTQPRVEKDGRVHNVWVNEDGVWRVESSWDNNVDANKRLVEVRKDREDFTKESAPAPAAPAAPKKVDAITDSQRGYLKKLEAKIKELGGTQKTKVPDVVLKSDFAEIRFNLQQDVLDAKHAKNPVKPKATPKPVAKPAEKKAAPKPKETKKPAKKEAVAPQEEGTEFDLSSTTAGESSKKMLSRLKDKYKNISDGNFILDNEEGTSGLINDLIDKLNESFQAFVEAAGKYVDIEYIWKKNGNVKTGRALKKLFSRRKAEEQMAMKQAEDFMKIVTQDIGNDYTKEDLADIVLSAEMDDYYKKLSTEQQAKVKRAKEWLRNYFDNALKRLADKDITVNFRTRILAELKEDYVNTTSWEKRNELLGKIREISRAQFVHIPYASWKQKLEGKTIEDKGQHLFTKRKAKLKQLVSQKRGAVTMHSLWKKGLIDKTTINPVEIIVNYGSRLGHDFSLTDIRDAAIEEKLLKIRKTKPRKVKGDVYVDESNISWAKVGKNLEGLTKYGEDAWIRSDVKNLIDDSLAAVQHSTIFQRLVSKVKMLAFYNPVFLPIYDVVQFGQTGLWADPRTMLKMPGILAKSIHEVWNKTDEWKEAQDLGLSSTPFNSPYNEVTKAINDLSSYKSGLAGYSQMLFKMAKSTFLNENNKPYWHLISLQPFYAQMWSTAWSMDTMIRQFTYNMMVKQGVSKSDAAQLAATFHGDYAKVPASSRKQLNRFLFTPTFKIAMIGAQMSMVKNLASATKKLAQGEPKSITSSEKHLAMGAMGTATMLISYDLFMRGLGFEPDEWGRSYKKIIDTDEGPKELVISWSTPFNLVTKYVQRFTSGMTDPETDNVPLKIAKKFAYEITPLIKITASLFANEADSGQRIYSQFDDWDVKGMKAGIYALTSIFAVLKEARPYIPGVENLENPSTTVGKENLKEMLGDKAAWVASQFVNAYVRSLPEQRMKAAAQRKKAALTEEIQELTRRGGEYDEKKVENFLKQLNDIVNQEAD